MIVSAIFFFSMCKSNYMVVGARVWRELTAPFCAGYEAVVEDRVGYEVACAAPACRDLEEMSGCTVCVSGGRTTWSGWRPRSSAKDMVAVTG